MAAGCPQVREQAQELLGAEALPPQEAHAVPPGLSGPQEDVRVLDEQLLQPDAHVVLVPTQVQVGLPQGVDHLLVLLQRGSRSCGGALAIILLMILLLRRRLWK